MQTHDVHRVWVVTKCAVTILGRLLLACQVWVGRQLEAVRRVLLREEQQLLKHASTRVSKRYEAYSLPPSLPPSFPNSVTQLLTHSVTHSLSYSPSYSVQYAPSCARGRETC